MNPAPPTASTTAAATEIVAVDCFPALLPLRKPLVMATYRIDDGPVLFVRIRTRGGAEGWGEAAASPIMSGETLVGMQAAVATLIAPRLIGSCVLDRARLSRELRASMYANGGALAAVDMAMLDLAGRILDVPAVMLLGGAIRRTVQPLWLVGGSGSVEKDVDEARALHAQGFRAFKLKAGLKPVEEEIRTVRLLREALGSDCLIAADANMGWDPTRAIRFTNGAAPFGLAFLEQPTAAGDIARMATVAAASPVPIGMDESLHGLADLHAHVAARAIGGASLKTIKLGGITPLVATAGVCEALGLSVNLAMMMESSLATAAMIHAACAIPRIDWGLSLGNLWLAEDPVTQPITPTQGLAHCPAGPGLGVTVDERRITALALH
ncbi:MAG: mandelate racemase/muconate lactonizing enzyme family protein [Variibacter sp.]